MKLMKSGILIMIISGICLGQVEFTGFTDILYVQDQGFGYGQFEVDLAVPLAEGVTVDAALAFDGTYVGMGAGFITFETFGSYGLMVGQFDVPLGIDYLAIPSPDRKLVTPPLLNEKTINAWNDVGLNLTGEAEKFNLNLFAVNGFCGEMAFGGRFGFKALEALEVGASYANDNSDATFMGVDLLGTFGFLETKLEYQMSDGFFEGDNDPLTEDRGHSGFYVQLCSELEDMLGLPVFGVARFGSWSADGDHDASGEADSASRITLGAGYRLADGVEFRIEYLSDTVDEGDSESALTLQAVVGF